MILILVNSAITVNESNNNTSKGWKLLAMKLNRKSGGGFPNQDNPPSFNCDCNKLNKGKYPIKIITTRNNPTDKIVSRDDNLLIRCLRVELINRRKKNRPAVKEDKNAK